MSAVDLTGRHILSETETWLENSGLGSELPDWEMTWDHDDSCTLNKHQEMEHHNIHKDLEIMIKN